MGGRPSRGWPILAWGRGCEIRARPIPLLFCTGCLNLLAEILAAGNKARSDARRSNFTAGFPATITREMACDAGDVAKAYLNQHWIPGCPRRPALVHVPGRFAVRKSLKAGAGRPPIKWGSGPSAHGEVDRSSESTEFDLSAFWFRRGRTGHEFLPADTSSAATRRFGLTANTG
jgi:hypothetical protein